MSKRDGDLGIEVGLAIGGVVSHYLTNHDEELNFIKKLTEMEKQNAGWDDMIFFIEENKNLFPEIG